MYKFKISSIHCMSCVRNIEDALKEVDSNIKITVELKEKIVSIDSMLDIDVLRNSIERAGHKVDDVFRT